MILKDWFCFWESESWLSGRLSDDPCSVFKVRIRLYFIIIFPFFQFPLAYPDYIIYTVEK